MMKMFLEKHFCKFFNLKIMRLCIHSATMARKMCNDEFSLDL